MPSEPSTLFDGFGALEQGMNSGVELLSLSKSSFAYGTNTTVRGRYITHRPAYQKQKLSLDASIDFGKLRFQGACYYQPDFGSESIVAQIGGRLFQFIPDSNGNAFVFNRTIRVPESGSSFITKNVTTNSQQTFFAVIENISDTPNISYVAGTSISTVPSFASVLFNDVSVNPVLVNNDTQVRWTFVAILPPNSVLPSGLSVGNQVYVNSTGTDGAVKWKIISTGTSGTSPTITLQFTAAPGVSGSTITYPAGSLIYYTTNPSPPQVIGSTVKDFLVPSVNSQVTIELGSAFQGIIGQGISFGGGIFEVISIPDPISKSGQSTVSTTVQSKSGNASIFSYDPNPANVLQAWLWQSENYVIVEDGESRPVIFDGKSSRRSITPSFVGTLASAFKIPQIGTVGEIILKKPYSDAIGSFINISPIGFFPFLMQVTSVNVDGNKNAITAANVTGQTSVNQTIPIGTPVASTLSPLYAGVLTTPIPKVEAQVTISVSPPFNGKVNDSILFTDGTGPLTTYQFTVAAITGGGAGLVLNNVTAPLNLIINAGYPIVSETNSNNEIPIGRMGAYVQGRNWISSIDGKSFIASDQVGDSSGTAEFGFRDAVLKWSLNTSKFPIPGGAGRINCMIALSTLDQSLGQGPLQVLCDNAVFSCNAPSDATEWTNTDTPILPENVIGFGGTGQNAAVVSNSDLIFKSSDASVHSLRLSRQDFNTWGNFPISQEMKRVVEQENLNLLDFVTNGISNNRCFISCAPIDSASGIYSQGLMVQDYDVVSSLQGKIPPVWDGVWKDLNFLQIVSGKFNKVDRTFAFAVNSDSQVELWELLKNGTFDNSENPIIWSFESPLIFNNVKGKGTYDLGKLISGAIYLKNLVGKASVKIWYRPDFSECWTLWSEFSFCADNVKYNDPDQYRMRVGFGEPSIGHVDMTVNKPSCVGRFFQTRFEITGSFKLMGSVFGFQPDATPEPTPVPKWKNE